MQHKDLQERKAKDALEAKKDCADVFKVKRSGLTFSLSGMENQVQKRIEQGENPANVARFALNTVADIVRRTTEAAREGQKGLPVLFSGGVASNRILRQYMTGALFAQPRYSTDNAMGVAILAHRLWEGEQ